MDDSSLDLWLVCIAHSTLLIRNEEFCSKLELLTNQIEKFWIYKKKVFFLVKISQVLKLIHKGDREWLSSRLKQFASKYLPLLRLIVEIRTV